MKTYFVRHTAKFGVTDETVDALWRNHQFAIHYPSDKSGNNEHDSQSTNHEDYDGFAARGMKTLNALAKEGGYVCAMYRGKPGCLVGKVKPDSKIEVVPAVWDEIWPQKKGQEAIIKRLALIECREVRRSDYALLMVGCPRQGTITHWPSARNTISDIVEGIQREKTLEELLDSQQETMCSEFLRLQEAKDAGLPRLQVLLLPVGRTMRGIDICGIADDEKVIFAQVTMYGIEQAWKKLEVLKDFGEDSSCHRILFCKTNTADLLDGIKVFPIETVFEKFTASTIGKRFCRSNARIHSVNRTTQQPMAR